MVMVVWWAAYDFMNHNATYHLFFFQQDMTTASIAVLLRRRRVLQVLLVVVLSVHGKCALTMSTNAAATASPSPKKIVLWNSGTCPYAQRAWIALLEKDVDFEHRIVDLANKPADFVAKYAAAILGASADPSSVRAKVPLLEYGDDTLVVESEDVIKFIGATLGTNDDMYPKKTDTDARRARIESFILQAFESTIRGYYKLMTATNEAEVEAGKLEFCQALLYNMAPHIPSSPAGGPFCIGETFSVAECYAAPWVHRFQVTVPYFRGVSMSDVLSSSSEEDDAAAAATAVNRKKVMAWMNAVCNRPSVLATNGPNNDHLLKMTRTYFIKYVTPNSPAAAAAAAALEQE
jgi:glutathione S-transferase